MSEPQQDPARIFVVGCPRSGTTLVQSMLAAHPAVLALPETHALWGLQSRNPLVRLAGFRAAAVVPTWHELPALGVAVTGEPPRRTGTYVRRFTSALDRAAADAGRSAWSEKTPGHLRSLSLIRRYVPAAHVVHVVREGTATVASLYVVSHEHGDAWAGSRSVELCLTRWRNDLQRTAAAAHRPRHVVLSYEALVSDPAAVLERLNRALGLAGDPRAAAIVMSATYQSHAAGLTSPGEGWKSGVSEALADRREARAGALTPEQAALVARGVASVSATYRSLPFL